MSTLRSDRANNLLDPNDDVHTNGSRCSVVTKNNLGCGHVSMYLHRRPFHAIYQLLQGGEILFWAWAYMPVF